MLRSKRRSEREWRSHRKGQWVGREGDQGVLESKRRVRLDMEDYWRGERLQGMYNRTLKGGLKSSSAGGFQRIETEGIWRLVAGLGLLGMSDRRRR